MKNVGFRAFTHYVHSDLLDGVAGPNSYSNDNYIFTTINYSIRIDKPKKDITKIKQPKQEITIDTNICP